MFEPLSIDSAPAPTTDTDASLVSLRFHIEECKDLSIRLQTTLEDLDSIVDAVRVDDLQHLVMHAATVQFHYGTVRQTLTFED